MIVVNGETYELKLYKLLENSSYDYETTPSAVFFGRPSTKLENKNYRVSAGIHANNDAITIIASNLPSNIKANDRIEFMGEIKTIESVGFFLDSSLIVNAKILSNDYLMRRSPKGITLI